MRKKNLNKAELKNLLIEEFQKWENEKYWGPATINYSIREKLEFLEDHFYKLNEISNRILWDREVVAKEIIKEILDLFYWIKSSKINPASLF